MKQKDSGLLEVSYSFRDGAGDIKSLSAVEKNRILHKRTIVLPWFWL